MSLNVALMRAMLPQSNMSISFQRRSRLSLCGRWEPRTIRYCANQDSSSFVAFISGAFAAVLVLVSVIDPVFLHFEITPDRTVLFYLGVFTSILAVSRGMVPATNQTFDPEILLTEVVGYVHYMPESWEGRLHSHQVGVSTIY